MSDQQQPTAFIVAVTGHRPDKLGGWRTPNPLFAHVVTELASAFKELKPDFVITGMALGVDQWAAELCHNMGIKFVAAIPFEGQDEKWPPHARAKYNWLLSLAHQRYTICSGGYEPWKMHKRNEWMVNSCHKVVAVWNGSPGGTAGCVKYAESIKKPIHYCKLPAAGMDLAAKGPAAQQLSFPGTNPENKPAESKPTDQTKRLLDI